MIRSIKYYCDSLSNDFANIPAERKALLEEVSAYIRTRHQKHEAINLLFVCTHNSRRSHFGQVWAQVAAHYYKIPGVKSFSGGTEATAFNANAINALKRIGFIVEEKTPGNNPVCEVHFSEKAGPVICFSKLFSAEENPQTNFAAIMTCGEAEQNCPFIPGADLRVAIPFEDPKLYDNTPQRDKAYDERCRQIATETFYIFSKIV